MLDDAIDIETLLDELYDLKHDLGKYIRLPIALLPSDAGQDDIREALETALLKTRKGPGGIRSARQIWLEFSNVWGGVLKDFRAFERLASAVSRAIDWEARLAGKDQTDLDREALSCDFDRVGQAIEEFIEEVANG